MTKFANITYTQSQAEALVEYYNKHAKHALTADQAHLIFHDNSDTEMTDAGHTGIEIGQYETKTGVPHTYTVEGNQVTLEWVEV